MEREAISTRKAEDFFPRARQVEPRNCITVVKHRGDPPLTIGKELKQIPRLPVRSNFMLTRDVRFPPVVASDYAGGHPGHTLHRLP